MKLFVTPQGHFYLMLKEHRTIVKKQDNIWVVAPWAKKTQSPLLRHTTQSPLLRHTTNLLIPFV